MFSFPRLTLLAFALVATPVAAQTGQTASPPPDPDAPITDGTTTTFPDGTVTRAGEPVQVPEGTVSTNPQATPAMQPATPSRTAAAQTGQPMVGQPMMPDTRARWTQFDRDLGTMRQSPDHARFQTERDALRRDYDALGAQATPDARRQVMNRMDRLEADVRTSRMTTAPRADFFRMADMRMAESDRQLDALRGQMMQMPQERRAEMAVDLIALRRQQDMYRNETFRLRGAGARGYEAARSGAVTNLNRIDSQFRESYGTAQSRHMGTMQQGAQQQGTQGNMQPQGTQQQGTMQQGTMQQQGTQQQQGTRPQGTTAPSGRP